MHYIFPPSLSPIQLVLISWNNDDVRKAYKLIEWETFKHINN